MSKKTAQGSPDGPRFIFGKENVNWSGPSPASESHGSIAADGNSIRNELTEQNQETEEEKYDRIYDEVTEKLEDFIESSPYSSDYIRVLDSEGRLSDMGDAASEYADELSTGGKVSKEDDYTVEVSFTSSSDFETAVQSEALGLNDGSHGFPDDWKVDPDSATVSIPVSSILYDPKAQESLDELAESMEAFGDYGTLDDTIQSDLFYEAAGKILSDTDRRVTASDLSDNDVANWEEENDVEDFEDEEEWEDARDDYASQQYDLYYDALDDGNIRDAFIESVEQGDIVMDNVDYNPYAKEFTVYDSDLSALVEKTLSDNGAW